MSSNKSCTFTEQITTKTGGKNITADVKLPWKLSYHGNASGASGLKSLYVTIKASRLLTCKTWVFRCNSEFYFHDVWSKQILWFDHCFGWLSFSSLVSQHRPAPAIENKTACKKREKRLFGTFPLKLSFPPTVFALSFFWVRREKKKEGETERTGASVGHIRNQCFH